MYPEEKDMPETLEGLVAAYGDEEDPMLEYSHEQSTQGAQAAIAMSLASGIKGDFKKAFYGPPKDASGREVALAPYDKKASKLALLLADTVEKMIQEAEAQQKAMRPRPPLRRLLQ